MMTVNAAVSDSEDDASMSDEDDGNGAEVPENMDHEWLHMELTPFPYEFHLNGPQSQQGASSPDIIPDEEDRIVKTSTSEILQAPYDFGHAPFSKLHEKAMQGILPQQLTKCNIPVCSAFQYEKATKRA